MQISRAELVAVLTSLRARLPLLSPTQLLRAQEAIRQADRVLNQERCRWFGPNKAQQRYIDAVAADDSYIVVFAAGNGVGKTAATVIILAACIWPEMAAVGLRQPVLQNWPYPRDVRIVSTPQQIAEGGAIQREIATWWPRGQYEGIAAGKPYKSQYRARDWTVTLMSYDQDPQAYEGATIGMHVFDEPPPKAIYNACVARMRRGGRILFPGTPLTDAAWMLDDLVSKADGKSIRLVHGDVDEALIEHGGFLRRADVDRMLASYDPDELDARKSGKFLHLSGRIFKGFDRTAHVAPVEIKVPVIAEGGRPVQVYQAVDPAIGKPMACLWAYVNATGTIHVYDEHPIDCEFQGARDANLTVSDYAKLFKEREHGRKNITRILDRHFGNARRTLGGLSLIQEFGDAGIDFFDSYTVGDVSAEVETGISKIKSYLAFDRTKPQDALNRPRLVISPTCKNTIAALERWSRDPKTGKPKDEYKDFADCVRYLVMANPTAEIAADWSGRKGMPHYGVGNT